MSERLKKDMTDLETRNEFLQTVWYESERAGLDKALVLGLIQLESNFRKFASSKSGALGFMQVRPLWVQRIGDGDTAKLFQTQTNLRFGCVILRHYIELEQGDLARGLERYRQEGRSFSIDDVLKARKLWVLAD